MTGADFRAHELADRLAEAGWTVHVSDETGAADRIVTVTATRPDDVIASIAYRSMTAPDVVHSTSLARAELEFPSGAKRLLEGPRAVRAWLELLATGNSGR